MSAIVALSLALRVPSFFDPPWVNDEGTYYAVAQALAHGSRLYVDVWENKPPAIYLLYAAVYQLFGPSLIAIRIVAALAALGIVILTFKLAERYVRRSSARFAALLAGLLLAVPFLEGTTANAEVFLALLASLGIYLALFRSRPIGGGVAMGMACLFKAVGLFDALALALCLTAASRKRVGIFALGIAIPTSAIVIWAASSGTLGSMVRDAVLYDLGYVGRSNGGASFPWLVSAKLAALAGVTVLFFSLVQHESIELDRSSVTRYFPFLWLVFAAMGALISGRFFGHYTIQAIVPFSLSLALVLERRLELGRLIRALPLAYALIAGILALTGWFIAAGGSDSIFARRLQYYANFARYALGIESLETYRSQIDDSVNRNLTVAGRLRGLPAGKLLVWGNSPWIYVLSHRLSATAYTSTLRQPAIPDEASALRGVIRGRQPREIVVITPPKPGIPPVVRRDIARHYRAVSWVGNATIYIRD